MCLVGLRHDTDPRSSLVLVANRDEFHARRAEPARFWPDAPDVLAGRDLEAGGTWLGITRSGRFATITNVREPPRERLPGMPSRGSLVREFLERDVDPLAYAEDVARRGGDFDGFNLVVGDARAIAFVSTLDRAARLLERGDHGISNGAIDSPWPKVRRVKEGLVRLGGESELEPYFELLADRSGAPDEELPDTGVGLAMERFLAPAFLVGPVYGTRASTVVTFGRDGVVRFAERSFAPDGSRLDERRYEFAIGARA